MDEIPLPWTEDGLRSAVKILLGRPNTLFDDIIKNLERHLVLGSRGRLIIDPKANHFLWAVISSHLHYRAKMNIAMINL